MDASLCTAYIYLADIAPAQKCNIYIVNILIFKIMVSFLSLVYIYTINIIWGKLVSNFAIVFRTIVYVHIW